MGYIRLFGGTMTSPHLIDQSGMPARTITEWVREYTLPLYWRCGHGTCGACAVHIRYPEEQEERWVTLSGKEKNVLLRHKLITPEAHALTTIKQTPAIWRLACHVLVAPEDKIEVIW